MFSTLIADISTNLPDSLRILEKKVAEQAMSDPGTFLQTLGERILEFGLKVVAAFLIYIIGAWCIKKIRRAVKAVMTKKKLELSLSSFLMSLLTITLYIILIVLAISALGVNTTSIAALLAAGGVAIGAALSGTVQNFTGGLMLMIFKPFKAGDFINVMGYSGTVADVSIVSTRIITVDNREITIPNGELSNSNIDNYSAKPLRRVEWQIGVEYGSDAELFFTVAKEILARDNRILDSSTPGAADPFVALSNLNDHNVIFVIRVWVKGEDYWGVYFDNLKTLYSELPEKGFSFAYPHMDVTISKESLNNL